MRKRLILTAGELELHLLPAVAGSIARFDRVAEGKCQQLMRGTDKDDVTPLDVGCFPLVPFANRIRGGCFTFRGETIRLAPNMPPDPSPLHGQGWLAGWEVISSNAATAELTFRHSAGEWPWDYEARIAYALDQSGLSIVLTCRNLSDRPMPCGLALHPYHACDPSTVLATRVECAWTVDANVLPLEKVAAEGRYDLRHRRVCGAGLDNGFGGWAGVAEYRWPGEPAALRMSSPDARYFQLYAPPEGGLFVAEPVQHANAALNAPEQEWPTLGMTVLSPGDTRGLHVRYDVLAG